MRLFLAGRKDKTGVEFILANKDKEIQHHFKQLLPDYDIRQAFCGETSIPQFSEPLKRGDLR